MTVRLPVANDRRALDAIYQGAPAQRGPVVAAIDLRETSERVVQWACNYATAAGASLLLLHIIHDPAATPGFYHDADQRSGARRPQAAIANEMMEAFLERLRSVEDAPAILFDLQTVLVEGLPPGRIIEIAEKYEAQLVVIGHNLHTGLEGFLARPMVNHLIGSVAAPVVIVN